MLVVPSGALTVFLVLLCAAHTAIAQGQPGEEDGQQTATKIDLSQGAAQYLPRFQAAATQGSARFGMHYEPVQDTIKQWLRRKSYGEYCQLLMLKAAAAIVDGGQEGSRNAQGILQEVMATARKSEAGEAQDVLAVANDLAEVARLLNSITSGSTTTGKGSLTKVVQQVYGSYGGQDLSLAKALLARFLESRPSLTQASYDPDWIELKLGRPYPAESVVAEDLGVWIEALIKKADPDKCEQLTPEDRRTLGKYRSVTADGERGNAGDGGSVSNPTASGHKAPGSAVNSSAGPSSSIATNLPRVFAEWAVSPFDQERLKRLDEALRQGGNADEARRQYWDSIRNLFGADKSFRSGKTSQLEDVDIRNVPSSPPSEIENYLIALHDAIKPKADPAAREGLVPYAQRGNVVIRRAAMYHRLRLLLTSSNLTLREAMEVRNQAVDLHAAVQTPGVTDQECEATYAQLHEQWDDRVGTILAERAKGTPHGKSVGVEREDIQEYIESVLTAKHSRAAATILSAGAADANLLPDDSKAERLYELTQKAPQPDRRIRAWYSQICLEQETRNLQLPSVAVIMAVVDGTEKDLDLAGKQRYRRYMQIRDMADRSAALGESVEPGVRQRAQAVWLSALVKADCWERALDSIKLAGAALPEEVAVAKSITGASIRTRDLAQRVVCKRLDAFSDPAAAQGPGLYPSLDAIRTILSRNQVGFSESDLSLRCYQCYRALQLCRVAELEKRTCSTADWKRASDKYQVDRNWVLSRRRLDLSESAPYRQIIDSATDPQLLATMLDESLVDLDWQRICKRMPIAVLSQQDISAQQTEALLQKALARANYSTAEECRFWADAWVLIARSKRWSEADEKRVSIWQGNAAKLLQQAADLGGEHQNLELCRSAILYYEAGNLEQCLKSMSPLRVLPDDLAMLRAVCVLRLSLKDKDMSMEGIGSKLQAECPRLAECIERIGVPETALGAGTIRRALVVSRIMRLADPGRWPERPWERTGSKDRLERAGACGGPFEQLTGEEAALEERVRKVAEASSGDQRKLEDVFQYFFKGQQTPDSAYSHYKSMEGAFQPFAADVAYRCGKWEWAGRMYEARVLSGKGSVISDPREDYRRWAECHMRVLDADGPTLASLTQVLKEHRRVASTPIGGAYQNRLLAARTILGLEPKQDGIPCAYVCMIRQWSKEPAGTAAPAPALSADVETKPYFHLWQTIVSGSSSQNGRSASDGGSWPKPLREWVASCYKDRNIRNSLAVKLEEWTGDRRVSPRDMQAESYLACYLVCRNREDLKKVLDTYAICSPEYCLALELAEQEASNAHDGSR